MGRKRERHLIERVADMNNLEAAYADAAKIASDATLRYIKRFDRDHEGNMKRIQRMILSGDFPTKTYEPRKIQSECKEREVCPLAFDPWSILFHAIKNVLAPIVRRVSIFDASAGIKGKGQQFAALRTRRLIRRYRVEGYAWADCKKFYQTIPHELATWALRKVIDDERFIRMVELTVLDYEGGMDAALAEEDAMKRKSCSWASVVPLKQVKGRGVTIGGAISSDLGNLVMAFALDHWVKDTLGVKAYHRHCDDMFIGASSVEEAHRLLTAIDGRLNSVGMCLKHTSYYADIYGRRPDFVGYVYKGRRMDVRKRTKKKFARAMTRIKSKARRTRLLGSYWGMFKIGSNIKLWKKITNDHMAFADFGIKTNIVSERDGRKFFEVPSVQIRSLVNHEITVHDFTDDVKVKDKDGRVSILFSEGDGEKQKTITSSSRIKEKLLAARKMEEEDGAIIFPQKTRIIRVMLNNGMCTYDIE